MVELLPWTEITERLCIATAGGMVVGFERQLRHKIAGLRTHMLVALGAAAIMLVGLELDTTLSQVIQGVVTGIGFIGAGTIIHASRHVEGVTTAASLWTSTIMGLAAGAGFYVISTIVLGLVLLILVACSTFEHFCQLHESQWFRFYARPPKADD